MVVDKTNRIASRQQKQSQRVAIIHDWLTGMRGGERVLEVLCALYEDVEIFTAFYDAEKISDSITSRPIHVSPFNSLPGVLQYYRHLLPVYPLVARSLSTRLSRAHAEKPFDLVISVSHCVAKNVRVPNGVPHYSYCLTPMRYIWDQFQAYFGGRTYEPIARVVASWLRRWDVRGASNVDAFSGISSFISNRIKRYYDRDSSVVYPPVPTKWLSPRDVTAASVSDSFLVVNALVPYKNTHIVVQAFNELGLPLTIVGDGPERKALEKLAGPNITFAGKVGDEQLAELYRDSAALVFAAEEDFGMTPVEMQASGGPVIAYGRGGSLETVCSEPGAQTGVLFSELSAASLAAAVRQFLDQRHLFTVDNCLAQAKKFSRQEFETSLLGAISDMLGSTSDSSHSLDQRISSGRQC